MFLQYFLGGTGYFVYPSLWGIFVYSGGIFVCSDDMSMDARRQCSGRVVVSMSFMNSVETFR